MTTLLNTFNPLKAQIQQTELAYNVAAQALLDYKGSDPKAVDALDAVLCNRYADWVESRSAYNAAYYALPQ